MRAAEGHGTQVSAYVLEAFGSSGFRFRTVIIIEATRRSLRLTKKSKDPRRAPKKHISKK